MTVAFPDIAVRTIRVSEGIPSRLLAMIPQEEVVSAQRFRMKSDRARFILGRGLLRSMVGAALDRAPELLPFGRDQHGKPTLPEAGDIAFNVSHSGDVVMVAVGRARSLGLDVEQHRNDIDVIEVGRHILTQDEMATLAAAEPSRRIALFFRQWVFKEALVKGLGTGLSLEPRRFQIEFGDDDPAVRFVGDGSDDIGSGWRFVLPEVREGYSAALAVLP